MKNYYLARTAAKKLYPRDITRQMLFLSGTLAVIATNNRNWWDSDIFFDSFFRGEHFAEKLLSGNEWDFFIQNYEVYMQRRGGKYTLKDFVGSAFTFDRALEIAREWRSENGKYAQLYIEGKDNKEVCIKTWVEDVDFTFKKKAL